MARERLGWGGVEDAAGDGSGRGSGGVFGWVKYYSPGDGGRVSSELARGLLFGELAVASEPCSPAFHPPVCPGDRIGVRAGELDLRSRILKLTILVRSTLVSTSADVPCCSERNAACPSRNPAVAARAVTRWSTAAGSSGRCGGASPRSWCRSPYCSLAGTSSTCWLPCSRRGSCALPSLIADTHINFAFFPLDNPGIVSIPLAFFLGWLGSVTDPQPSDPARFARIQVRALTGVGAERGGHN
jgi:hypothetical protein